MRSWPPPRPTGLDILAGLWLVVAPFALGFGAVSAAVWNSVIAGIAIALLASSRETHEGLRHPTASWINAIIGVWLVLSPFLLGFSGATVAMWNSVVLGIAVIVFALWSAMSTPAERTS